MMLDFGPAAVDALMWVGSSPTLMLLVKVTALLSLGLAAAAVLRRARAAVRHLVLACTFLAVGALPLVSAAVPAWSLVIPLEQGDEEAAESPGRVTTAPAALTIDMPAAVAGGEVVALPIGEIFGLFWATGTGVLLAWLGLAIAQLQQLRRQAVPALELSHTAQRLARHAGVRRAVAIMTHGRVVAPLTCGVRHATILLPEDAPEWDEGELHRALVHELAHVRRFDWAVQMTARGVCAAFWFHPLVWVAWRQLRLEAERACDDAVVRSSDEVEYAEQLVGLARRLSGAESGLSLSMAGRSDLSRRVTSLLDGRRRRGPAGRNAIMLSAAASLVVLVSLAPIHAVEGGADTLTIVDNDAAGQGRPSRQEMSLYRAASRGNVARMTELLALGADVNRTIDGDGTPLIGAARGGHYEAVKLLLDRGADPNLAVEGDGNPLIMAAREGHAAIVKLLLDRGAQIDQVVPSDETALIQASAEGRADVVTLLLERRADPNLRVWVEDAPGRDGEWRSPLGQARRGRHAAVVQLLLAAGATQ